MNVVNVSPSQLIGATGPESKVLAPESEAFILRLRNHYKGQGKASAAHNYSRHMRGFLSWAEKAGYSISALPPDAVENFISSLAAAGQKDTTLYVMRAQLKSAFREAASALGENFDHLEFAGGKPKAIKVAQKAREKEQAVKKKLIKTAERLQGIKAAQQTIFGEARPTASSTAPYLDGNADLNPAIAYSDLLPESTPMSVESEPQGQEGQSMPASVPATVAQASNGQPIIVVAPSQPAGATRPAQSLAQQAQGGLNKGASPARGVTINNHTFTGPFIKVSRIADGSEPQIPWGTETYVTTLPASQVAPHGDLGAFLQNYVLPMVRIGPSVTTVQFVFHELNDRRQPTGRRDELVVTVPASQAGAGSAPSAPPVGLGGLGSFAPAAPQAPQTLDRATEYLLQKLDKDAEEAKKRADELQEKMRQASDAHTAFLLQQQFQKEQDLRRQIEDERRREQDRMAAAAIPSPAAPLMPPMPFPTILPPEPRDNTAAEFAKALSESQGRMMELMIAAMNKPVPMPPPPPAQKDVAEWIVPLMTQMNQQMTQQQQAQQQMLVGIMQANQQFMQALITRESPELKFMMAQLQEVRAAANTPKADEMESFADKLQKMKMVSDMLGGGGGTNVLSELLANADAIGEGAAKVIAAAKGGTEAKPEQLALKGVPAPAPVQRQLPAPAAPQAQTAQQPPPVPPAALEGLNHIVQGVENNEDQLVVNGLVSIIQGFSQDEHLANQTTGRRILAALKNAEDEGELYTLAKNLWIVTGQQYDRRIAKVVAAILAKWYSPIHEQIFGSPKELEVDLPEEDEGEEVDRGEEIEDEGGPSAGAGNTVTVGA